MLTMNWWTRILDFISPRLCVVCGERLSPTERSICSVCLLHLPRTTYQFTPDDNPMAQLFWHLTPIKRAAALLYYEPHSELARLIYDLKYHDRPDIGEDMGRLMANEMQLARFFDGIDVLLPVPLSRKRLRQRGYNQSEQLAIGVSDITTCLLSLKPCAENISSRVRPASAVMNVRRTWKICLSYLTAVCCRESMCC